MTLQYFDDFFSKFNCQSEINYFKDSNRAEFIDYVYFQFRPKKMSEKIKIIDQKCFFETFRETNKENLLEIKKAFDCAWAGKHHLPFAVICKGCTAEAFLWQVIVMDQKFGDNVIAKIFRLNTSGGSATYYIIF